MGCNRDRDFRVATFHILGVLNVEEFLVGGSGILFNIPAYCLRNIFAISYDYTLTLIGI